ncbi:microfibrillar-associated protein 1-like [Scylla paramamosain]|uniref:microfibrillar-associated protein 1-like n=1 Tax=Scylla paramamosain TaxID=85552 RepID=UPI003083A458
MDNSSWTAPPGAAQPMGIQSTAGAVPVMNDKGEVSMKKVKVQRYVSGKRPDYAPASSDEEEEEEEDFTRPQRGGPPSPPHHKSLTEAEMADPRLRRLLAQRAQAESDEEMETDVPRRRVTHQAEVVDLSEGEAEDDTKEEDQMEEEEEEEEKQTDFSAMPEMRASHRLAESDSESEDEVDEDELALRRLNMRQRALMKVQQQEELLGKEEEGSEESSEEESSEYSEETDSEEEGPRLKPVFVRKKDRVTIHQKEQQQLKIKQQEVEGRKRVEERRRETLRMIEQENRGATGAGRGTGADTSDPLNTINTDDEADDAEYEAWKLRELRRLKRDKEEREAAEKEREEVDKLRTMGEEERRVELRNNPKVITNKATKGKYKFLQKYYHRGSFFLDTEEDVLKRDFSGATLEDHFDKTILPKVMQVKNFGRSGRTKYTHLVDQDTTSFDSPWAADSQMNHKFFNANAGGMKQSFDRPSLKKRVAAPPPNAPAPRK